MYPSLPLLPYLTDGPGIISTVETPLAPHQLFHCRVSPSSGRGETLAIIIIIIIIIFIIIFIFIIIKL